MYRSPNLFYNNLNPLINQSILIIKQKINSNIILIIFWGDAHTHLVGFLGSCAAHNQGRTRTVALPGSCACANGYGNRKGRSKSLLIKIFKNVTKC
jgi:hypothetical protein